MAMAPVNRPLGGLTVGAGGQMMTPEQVKIQREMARSLMEQGRDASPVGHWSGALARALAGFAGGYQSRKANETESNETARALSAFQNRSGMQQPSPVASALAGGQAPAIPAGADGIRQGLISRGLPEHIADAFILNFQDESGLNPGINEISPTVPGSRGGFGLYQLTGPRRTAYEAFAADRGVDPADVDAQLDWLMYELQGPEAKAASSIMSAPDTGTAAAAIVNNFLRPAPEHRTARANRYMGGAGAGVSAVPASGNVSEIAALLADPWLPASARGVLEAEMNQQMQMQNASYEAQLQNQDPLRQLQIQQAQLELDAAMNPAPAAPSYVFEGGQWWMEAPGAAPVAVTSPNVNPTSAMQNYDALIAQNVPEAEARTMAFGGGGVNVNVGGSNPAPPQGYRNVYDDVGNLVSQEPIPGGPAAMGIATDEAAAANAKALEDRQANIVLDNIDRALEGATGWTTGMGGGLFSNIPGSTANDMRATLDTIKANIGFDQIAAMRAASPTGAALGSVTETELRYLQSVAGSLDQSQTKEQFEYNLNRLREAYMDIVNGPSWREQQQASDSATVPSGLFSGYTRAQLGQVNFDAMTEAELAEWERAVDALGGQ